MTRPTQDDEEADVARSHSCERPEIVEKGVRKSANTARKVRAPRQMLPRHVIGSIIQISASPGGIPKRAIPEAYITAEGIRGDRWSHPEIHGGPNQALLIITSEGIDELVAQGFQLYPGALGENLTTLGLDRRQFRLGQRYRAGEVFLEVTKPRAPCASLNVYGSGIQRAVFDSQVKAGDSTSPRWGLSGFYARVLQAGTLHSGDPIALDEQLA